MHSLIYHEKKQHGTIDFPVEYHYVDKKHPRYVMPHHWHKEWELIRVLDGTVYLVVDEEVIKASTGDIILIRGGSLHGHAPAEYIYECFLFDLQRLFQSEDPIKKHLRPFYRNELLPANHFPSGAYPEINNAVGRIMHCASAEETGWRELMLLGALCDFYSQILYLGLYCTNDNINALSKIDTIKGVLDLVEQNYASSLTLEEMANCAGMSPNYFCRVFKQIVHQSPIEYVLHYRIERASLLLLNPNLPITTVALDCGFNDHSYFIRVFKKLKGITPKQYQLCYAEKAKP